MEEGRSVRCYDNGIMVGREKRKAQEARLVGIAMDWRDRFFGKGITSLTRLPVANVAWPDPPSFSCSSRTAGD